MDACKKLLSMVVIGQPTGKEGWPLSEYNLSKACALIRDTSPLLAWSPCFWPCLPK